ncbi:MAG: nitroreductase family deazaflavin-dependent oxidoreductase [Steroidobacteraceae bacterium]
MAAQPSIEVQFFRTLNRVIEPMVRAGIGSPRIVPSGFIVLETRGRKTGRVRRTPLAATRIAQHVFVGTFRGERSQWIRNLAATPSARYWLGGKPRDATAFLIYEGRRFRIPKSLPVAVQAVARLMAALTKAGWAFAVLRPQVEKTRRGKPRARRSR